jgi:hypothetical protein
MDAIQQEPMRGKFADLISDSTVAEVSGRLGWRPLSLQPFAIILIRLIRERQQRSALCRPAVYCCMTFGHVGEFAMPALKNILVVGRMRRGHCPA